MLASANVDNNYQDNRDIWEVSFSFAKTLCSLATNKITPSLQE